MKKTLLALPIIVTSLLLCSCGSTVDLNTPKSSDLSQEYEYYQYSVNSLRSSMSISPEEADEIFIVLSSCGVDDKITQVYKNGSGNDTYYTVWYGLGSLDVYLKDNVVSKVLKSSKEVYPNNNIDSDNADSKTTETTVSTQKSYTADNESLKQLFNDNVLTKCDNLTVSYDDINTCFSVSYLPTDDTWNETTFVQQCFSDYISYCKESYIIDGITNIQFIISANLEDSHGNIEPKEVVQIRMNKDNFDKYNWENLEYENIYDSFSSDCDFFWIHPGILDKIKTEKIIYAP